MILFFFIFSVVFLFDLLSKMAVRRWLPLGSEIPLSPIFSLVHVQNTGIAFGLFPGKNFFFIGVGLFLTVGILMAARRLYFEDRPSCWVMAVVLGGAWGNLADRIFLGRVTDFLDFYIGVHHWPAFNVADSAICVGAGLLMIRSLKKGK